MLRVRDEAAAVLKLPALPVSVGRARRYVSSRLAEIGVDAATDDAALVTSELVTNAVVHAGTEITIRVEPLDDGARVEVGDRDATLPAARVPEIGHGTGRGLFLVEHFCDEWGVESTESGKIVWFVVGREADRRED
jgi:anti-sigma regulatory factor (Ser/Thr protein kinase)